MANDRDPARAHRYQPTVHWTGNLGSGTSAYRAYSRDHEIRAPGKSVLAASADPTFHGDPARWNPEELLVAALAECHLLFFLHLASAAGVVVTAYTDSPVGVMAENPDGSGQFEQVVLHPAVTVAEAGMCDRAQALHERIDALCFIARSVNFPVRCEPTVSVRDEVTPAATFGHRDAERVIAQYLAAWNETDANARVALLSACWAEGGVYVDPTVELAGAAELSRHIAAVQAARPGARLEFVSGVDFHHRVLRFLWRLVRADGTPGETCVDVAEVGPAGRLVRVVGFFGAPPPPRD